MPRYSFDPNELFRQRTKKPNGNGHKLNPFARRAKGSPNTKEERQLEHVLEKRDKDRIQALRAEEKRQKRLATIRSNHSGSVRFLRALDKYATEAECIGYTDCDVDLAGLAETCALRDLSTGDRHLLFAVAWEWVIGLAVRRGLSRDEYYNLAPILPEEGEPSALDDLKNYLGLN